MDRSQDIIFGVDGQKLAWVAPEGRPSAVSSVQVFPMGTGDDGTEEDAIAGSAAIDTVNTTVASASGDGQADPRKLNLTATTGVAVGDELLVTAAAGARERIEVVQIGSGFVRARHPMANAFSAADTVVGTRITAPLKTTWVSDTAKLTGGRSPIIGYRVRWAYTVASIKYVHDGYFDLVRYVGGHTVTARDVDQAFPGLQGMGPSFHRTDGYKALLDEAYSKVRWDLASGDTDDNAVRDQDAIDRATILALGIVIARSRVMQGADMRLLELAERDYDAFMQKALLLGAKVAIDDGLAGGGATAEPAPYWVK